MCQCRNDLSPHPQADGLSTNILYIVFCDDYWHVNKAYIELTLEINEMKTKTIGGDDFVRNEEATYSLMHHTLRRLWMWWLVQ